MSNFKHPQELLDHLQDLHNRRDPSVNKISEDEVRAAIRDMGYFGQYDVVRKPTSGEYIFRYIPHEDDPKPRSTEVSTFVDKAMFEAEEIPSDALEHPRVYLLQATADPLGVVAATSMMYEGKVVTDMYEITDEQRRHYFDECFKTTLKAPLEFIDFHFMVEGVTRSHTHQEVRQRTAVFAQESMRFAVKDNLRESVRPGPLINEDRRKREKYYEAIDKVNEVYQWLIANGTPAEEARGLLPHDTLTRLHHKVNMRNLMDELGKRTCTQAQFEWRAWAGQVRDAIRDYDPRVQLGSANDGGDYNWQFRYIAESPIFQPICFNSGKCMFKASMDRGCTIRERVEAGRFDEIQVHEWAGDPTAAWVK